MRADASDRQISSESNDTGHFRSHYSSELLSPMQQIGKAPAHSAALRDAEQALNNTSETNLPKLEIHLDDKINYFAEHSLVLDKARRIAFDFEHKPQIAKAVWGGGMVTMAAAAIIELIHPYCTTCGGAREIMGEKIKVICPTCSGIGVRRYTDSERAKMVGIKPEDWHKQL